MSKPTAVLASDMDGTFIPLEGNQQNQRDLAVLSLELQSHAVELLYVTGRHFELAVEAIQSHDLPVPAWLVCDVGTSIYRRHGERDFRIDEDYACQLESIVGELGIEQLKDRLSGISGLTLQPSEKQGRFKLSYDCDAEALPKLARRIAEDLLNSKAPYRVINSVDPFTGGGLIDLLPKGVSKAYALTWWVAQHQRSAEAIMFAGDSGNDLAALTAGYRSIIVGNASRSVVDEVTALHRAAGWHDRLFVASQPATSGVLQGFRYFRQTS